MVKQNRVKTAESDKRSRPKVKPIAVKGLGDDLAGLAKLPSGSIAIASGGIIQATWLSDARLQSAQRQALATQIGRVQGNHHLQGVIASVRDETKTDFCSQTNIFRYGARPCTTPPTHIRTMDDYIRLVERAESAYSGTSAVNMITRIRRTKYDTFAFGRFIRAPSAQGPLTPRSPLTAADVRAFACDIMISMPGGGHTDPSHILVGLDVRRYPGGTVLAPSGISATAATTWAGDVGSAYAEYVAQEKPSLEASNDQQTRLNYWNELSPYHDLMANIDGLAMSATGVPAQWQFDASQPLSVNLRRFFRPAAGTGRQRRFTLFAGVEGVRYRGRGSGLTITPASRSFIEHQIDLFSRGYTPTLVQPHLHQGGGLGNISYWTRWTRRAREKGWFVNRFINFIQDGLRQENP